MITPRATRLVRVADLQAFREAVVALALDGPPLDARDRLVIVPTRAAAEHLLRTIEDSGDRPAYVLPDIITPDELVSAFASRLPSSRDVLRPAEREVLLGVACREAHGSGHEPPFRLRPGLIAAILAFYDALRRRQKNVDTFERLALGMLEPGASYDRGAERLVRQTRFLAAAFREFERRSAEVGGDEHDLRGDVVAIAAPRPWRHVVVTVGDRAFDPYGLDPVDWDLLTRVPGLERLDVVITDRRLAGAAHEHAHRLLPGIEEVRVASAAPTPPARLEAPPGATLHVARDREEEVRAFARRVKSKLRHDGAALDRIALVVRQPLPYMYVARGVLQSAGIPCQLFDALPLAAEPYAAAVDLVLSCVSGAFARGPATALLRSPHFTWAAALNPDGGQARGLGGDLDPRDVAAIDRALSESGYLGDPDALDRLAEAWQKDATGQQRALRAATVLRRLASDLALLRSAAPAAEQLACLLTFLTRYERVPADDDPLRPRELRARAAIHRTIAALRDAYARFDAAPIHCDELAALVRRWIEGQTFSPRSGRTGVHVVDAASAPYGSFDHVQLAGVVDGEWPPPQRRNIFYSPALLRELGWSSEPDRIDGAKSAFADLLRLPAVSVAVSAFLLESDSPVSPSALVDELSEAGLDVVEVPPDETQIFDDEALTSPAPDARAVVVAQPWVAFRQQQPSAEGGRFRGQTAPMGARAWPVSALERYQDCPFKYFAADVLRLQEVPEDEEALSPRARGRFVHEVFQRFFEAWDARGGGTVTPERIAEARHLFAEVAEDLLARLPESDAALERARLLGSPISIGIVDTVLGIEASRPARVIERWLERRFDGEFSLGDAEGRRVALKGVADRVDLLEGRRLRVVDYKTGAPPTRKRALQVPVYALIAREQLSRRDGVPWEVDDASYVVLSGRRSRVPVVEAGSHEGPEMLTAARERLFAQVDGIRRGEFPPRPYDTMICRSCAYAVVCRRDYVDDE